MRARWVTAGLLVLLGIVHAQIWWGRASVSRVDGLRRELLRQEQANEAARLRNERLAAEVEDLSEGLQTVEEFARESLGMVKPNEIFVQIQGGHGGPRHADGAAP